MLGPWEQYRQVVPKSRNYKSKLRYIPEGQRSHPDLTSLKVCWCEKLLRTTLQSKIRQAFSFQNTFPYAISLKESSHNKTEYSVKNKTTVYNIGILLWQHVSVFLRLGWRWSKNRPNHFNFKFSPCIIIVNHFYYPTNALNYTNLRG